MMLSLSLLFSLASVVSSFSPLSLAPMRLGRHHQRQSAVVEALGRQQALYASTYDEAVAAAEKASSEFGKESVEAKSAWEAVEEMNDASSVAVATKPGLDEACDTADDAACLKYEEQMKEFQELIAKAKPTLGGIKEQLVTMKSVSLSSFNAAPTETNTANVEAATAKAEAASKEFGSDSPEAKAAWEAVEEMNDSMNSRTATMPTLDEECLTDALEKCAAFEDAMAALAEAAKKAA